MEFTPQIYTVGGIVGVLLGAVFYFARTRRSNGSEPDPRSVIRLAQKANRNDCRKRNRLLDGQLAESVRSTARGHMEKVKRDSPPDERKAGDDVDV